MVFDWKAESYTFGTKLVHPWGNIISVRVFDRPGKSCSNKTVTPLEISISVSIMMTQQHDHVLVKFVSLFIILFILIPLSAIPVFTETFLCLEKKSNCVGHKWSQELCCSEHTVLALLMQSLLNSVGKYLVSHQTKIFK